MEYTCKYIVLRRQCMKRLNQLTKKQLIDVIIEIRPKADAYDSVCKALGVKNNIMGYVNSLKNSAAPETKRLEWSKESVGRS